MKIYVVAYGPAADPLKTRGTGRRESDAAGVARGHADRREGGQRARPRRLGLGASRRTVTEPRGDTHGLRRTPARTIGSAAAGAHHAASARLVPHAMDRARRRGDRRRRGAHVVVAEPRSTEHGAARRDRRDRRRGRQEPAQEPEPGSAVARRLRCASCARSSPRCRSTVARAVARDAEADRARRSRRSRSATARRRRRRLTVLRPTTRLTIIGTAPQGRSIRPATRAGTPNGRLVSIRPTTSRSCT